MHHGDRLRRQLGVGVQLLNSRIIPRFHGSKEDAGQRRAIEHEFSRRHAFHIHNRHNAAHHHRKLNQAMLVEIRTLERSIGGAERHRLGLDLFDAAARTDRLIVQPDAGILLIGVGPLGINRIREGGARARNLDRSGGKDGRGQKAGDG